MRAETLNSLAQRQSRESRGVATVPTMASAARPHRYSLSSRSSWRPLAHQKAELSVSECSTLPAEWQVVSRVAPLGRPVYVLGDAPPCWAFQGPGGLSTRRTAGGGPGEPCRSVVQCKLLRLASPSMVAQASLPSLGNASRSELPLVPVP